MPRIHPRFLLALAFLLPACDPPDDPDTATIGGPHDFADDADDDDDDDDPKPRPVRPKRLSDAPQDHAGDDPEPGPEPPSRLADAPEPDTREDLTDREDP